MAVLLDLAQEGARREERRREIRAQRLLPALERQLPDRLVRRRPDAGDRGADVDAPERRPRLREELVDLRLVGEVGAERNCALELRGDRLGAVAALVVVHDDPRAFRRERAGAGGADAARRAGDDDALACEAGVHRPEPNGEAASARRPPRRSPRGPACCRRGRCTCRRSRRARASRSRSRTAP